jgi:S1-C subfamily serine protease
MSLSVLSSAVVVLAFSSGSGVGQSSHKEWNSYRLIAPSIASIMRGHDSIGTAALVDSSGLFLTHLDLVYAKRINARLSDGRIVTLLLKASDEPTHIALLQADDWIKAARPLTTAPDLKPGDTLMAVLPSGLIRAEFVGRKSGLVATSRRLMPLSEISFEAPAEKIGGGLVMTTSGEIVGFLNAALHSGGEADIQIQPTQMEGNIPRAKAGAARGTAGNARNTDAALVAPSGAQFAARALAQGPADMTVAYTPSPRMLRRTMASLIKGQDVDHPSIGVDVKNAQGQGGALIQKIDPGSGADIAGLKAGDIVIEIDHKPISDQVDLASIVMDQEVGSTLIIKVKRGQSLLIVPVVVGSKAGKNRLNPGSAT